MNHGFHADVSLYAQIHVANEEGFEKPSPQNIRLPMRLRFYASNARINRLQR